VESAEYGNWYESGDTNIITTLPRPQLLEGLRSLLTQLYEPANYFDRALRGFQSLTRQRTYRERWTQFRRLLGSLGTNRSALGAEKPSLSATLTFFVRLYRSLPGEFQKAMVRFLRGLVRTCPEQLPLAVPFLCMGYHCYRYTSEYAGPQIDRALARYTVRSKIPA
jgi:hypothetical protein